MFQFVTFLFQGLLVWQPLPILVFGATSVLAGLIAMLIPETLNYKLPDTIPEGESFGKDHRVFTCMWVYMLGCDVGRSGQGHRINCRHVVKSSGCLHLDVGATLWQGRIVCYEKRLWNLSTNNRREQIFIISLDNIDWHLRVIYDVCPFQLYHMVFGHMINIKIISC